MVTDNKGATVIDVIGLTVNAASDLRVYKMYLLMVSIIFMLTPMMAVTYT
jgi:hypothetical protein